MLNAPRLLNPNGAVTLLTANNPVILGRGYGGMERKDISRKVLKASLMDDDGTLLLEPLLVVGRGKVRL